MHSLKNSHNRRNTHNGPNGNGHKSNGAGKNPSYQRWYKKTDVLIPKDGREVISKVFLPIVVGCGATASWSVALRKMVNTEACRRKALELQESTLLPQEKEQVYREFIAKQPTSLYTGAKFGGIASGSVLAAVLAAIAIKKMRRTILKVKSASMRRRTARHLRKSSAVNRANSQNVSLPAPDKFQYLSNGVAKVRVVDIPPTGKLKHRSILRKSTPPPSRIKSLQVNFRGFNVRGKHFEDFMRRLNLKRPIFYEELTNKESPSSLWFERLLNTLRKSQHNANQKMFDSNRDDVAKSVLSILDAVANLTGDKHGGIDTILKKTTSEKLRGIVKEVFPILMHKNVLLSHGHGSRGDGKGFNFNPKHKIASVLLAKKI